MDHTKLHQRPPPSRWTRIKRAVTGAVRAIAAGRPRHEPQRVTSQYLVAHDAAIAENTKVTRKVEATANQVAEDTALIRSVLGDVAAGARFMCRLAAAWRFFQRQVFLPFGLPIIGLYGLWFYTQFHRFPTWLADCFKFLMAIL